MVALAPPGCGFEQNCELCHDPERRKQWGCDAPAAEPVFWIEPCHVCGGRQADCSQCQGQNRVPMFRCPNVLATDREIDCLVAASQVEHGVLPDPGGWQDQAATFVAAYAIARREIGYWQDKHREIAMKKSRK